MKLILLIVAVLTYLCLSNHISLYDTFVESSEPTDEAPTETSYNLFYIPMEQASESSLLRRGIF